MAFNNKEVAELMAHFVGKIRELGVSDSEITRNVAEYVNIDYAEFIYEPSNELKTRIQDYQLWCKGKRREDAGKLMEEIAVLAFSCIKDFDSLESYESYAQQHDLLVSGSSIYWQSFLTYVNLPQIKKTICIEAKNISKPLTDDQFTRLCSIIQNKLDSTCALGVFFTRKGASGFPSPAKPKRALQYARATQIIYHAKTGKFIIVFDEQDILQLVKPGSLPRIIAQKINDLVNARPIALHDTHSWKFISLPAHLARHIK